MRRDTLDFRKEVDAKIIELILQNETLAGSMLMQDTLRVLMYYTGAEDCGMQAKLGHFGSVPYLNIHYKIDGNPYQILISIQHARRTEETESVSMSIRFHSVKTPRRIHYPGERDTVYLFTNSNINDFLQNGKNKLIHRRAGDYHDLRHQLRWIITNTISMPNYQPPMYQSWA